MNENPNIVTLPLKNAIWILSTTFLSGILVGVAIGNLLL